MEHKKLKCPICKQEYTILKGKRVCDCLTNMKPSNYYIDNERFYQLMVFYNDAKKEGKEPSKELMNELSKCFVLVAKGFLRKPCFSNDPRISASDKEDMIQDSVYYCLKYMGNFDTEVYKNPFSYFTTVIHMSFLRMINKKNKKIDMDKKYTKHIIDTEYFTTYSSWIPKPAGTNNFSKDWDVSMSLAVEDEDENLMMLLDENSFLFFENTFEFEKESLDYFFGSEDE